MRLIIIIFIISLVYVTAIRGQSIQEKELDLVRDFETWHSADEEIKYDSLTPLLKRKVLLLLSDTLSLYNDFDTLEHYVKIITSDDHKLRLYSFDEMSGGTMHDMAVYAQYKTSKGIKALAIDSDISEEPNGWTDAIQYEIHTVNRMDVTYYLCFGWGTYGSGNHHNTIMFLTIINDSLILCNDCIDEKYSRLTAPRSKRTELTFDIKSNTISFIEFPYDYETGLYARTGKRVKVELFNVK